MELLDRVYQKNSMVVTRKIGDKIVIVPTQQENRDSEDVFIFTLNDMAAGIWVQIDGIASLRTIKKRILEEFKVTPERAEKDLFNFISQLEKSGMVFVSSDQLNKQQIKEEVI